MRKIALWTIIFGFCLFINKSAFADQSDAPQFIIINSQQVPITFDVTHTAKLAVPVDSVNKTLVIELPASEKWSLLVPDCNNQTLTPGQSITCDPLPGGTQLTLHLQDATGSSSSIWKKIDGGIIIILGLIASALCAISGAD